MQTVASPCVEQVRVRKTFDAIPPLRQTSAGQAVWQIGQREVVRLSILSRKSGTDFKSALTGAGCFSAKLPPVQPIEQQSLPASMNQFTNHTNTLRSTPANAKFRRVSHRVLASQNPAMTGPAASRGLATGPVSRARCQMTG